MCGVQVDSWSNETPYEQQPQQQLVGPSKPQQKYWSWLLLKCKVQHNCLAGWPQCLASGIVFKCWSASELVVWQPDNVQLSESHSPTVIDPCVSTHCTLWGSAPGFDSVIKSLSLILTVYSGSLLGTDRGVNNLSANLGRIKSVRSNQNISPYSCWLPSDHIIFYHLTCNYKRKTFIIVTNISQIDLASGSRSEKVTMDNGKTVRL